MRAVFRVIQKRIQPMYHMGTHDELMAQKSIYADFIGARKKAIGWKPNPMSI